MKPEIQETGKNEKKHVSLLIKYFGFQTFAYIFSKNMLVMLICNEFIIVIVQWINKVLKIFSVSIFNKVHISRYNPH